MSVVGFGGRRCGSLVSRGLGARGLRVGVVVLADRGPGVIVGSGRRVRVRLTTRATNQGLELGRVLGAWQIGGVRLSRGAGPSSYLSYAAS